mgnify:CR=1 FL=1
MNNEEKIQILNCDDNKLINVKDKGNINNYIIILISILISVLFALQGIYSVELCIQKRMDEFILKFEDISNRVSLNHISEEIIETLYEPNELLDISFIDRIKNIVIRENEKNIVVIKKSMDDTIYKIKKQKIPLMMMKERVGLLMGNIPYNYIKENTNIVKRLINEDVSQSILRIIAFATEEGVRRIITSGISGDILTQTANILTKILGYGAIIPYQDKILKKGINTFRKRLQISINEIYDLIDEITIDIIDDIRTNIYVYSSLSFAVFSISIIQISIVLMKKLTKENQQNSIIAIATRIINNTNRPLLKIIRKMMK